MTNFVEGEESSSSIESIGEATSTGERLYCEEASCGSSMANAGIDKGTSESKGY